MSPRRLARLLAWLGSAVLAAVLIATVWVVRHRTGRELLKEAATVVPGSMLSARNFHWTQMKSGRKQWELTAQQASFSDDKKSVRLKDAELSMVTDDGKHLMLRAQRALLALNANHVSRADLIGGLRVDYGDVVVTAQQASFTPDTDELEVPGQVTIESGGMKVTAIGLSARPHAQLFDLHRQVDTEVKPRPKAAPSAKIL